jgi:MFS family permease
MSDKTKRWLVLFTVSIVMMMGYVFWDIFSPVSTQLKAPVSQGGLGWTSSEYGFYAGSYSIFNIFLLMLFFGGIILDRVGIRLTGLMATGSMLLGAAINWWAVSRVSPAASFQMPFTFGGFIPLTMKTQVLVASLGFALFGMGCDITGITISKIVTKWFQGKELASAMGAQVAMARLGTASALSLGPLVATQWGLSAPLLVGMLFLLVGFLLFCGYCVADKRFDERKLKEKASLATAKEALQDVEGKKEMVEDDEKFHFRDFVAVLRNPGFWLIALLCVLFYSSIRPFMKFATDLLVNKFQADPIAAGWCVAIIPYGTIVLTPFFGSIYDRFGHGTLLMLLGCSFVLCSHLLLAIPGLTASWVAVLVMVLIGISFSLVPSALWPSIPKIVPLKQLGTAYSIIYYIQNLGLMLVPIWVGDVIGRHTGADGTVDFTVPMLVFAAFGALAVVTAIVLLIVDHFRHYGLESANIAKKGEAR